MVTRVCRGIFATSLEQTSLRRAACPDLTYSGGIGKIPTRSGRDITGTLRHTALEIPVTAE